LGIDGRRHVGRAPRRWPRPRKETRSYANRLKSLYLALIVLAVSSMTFAVTFAQAEGLTLSGEWLIVDGINNGEEKVPLLTTFEKRHVKRNHRKCGANADQTLNFKPWPHYRVLSGYHGWSQHHRGRTWQRHQPGATAIATVVFDEFCPAPEASIKGSFVARIEAPLEHQVINELEVSNGVLSLFPEDKLLYGKNEIHTSGLFAVWLSGVNNGKLWSAL